MLDSRMVSSPKSNHLASGNILQFDPFCRQLRVCAIKCLNGRGQQTAESKAARCTITHDSICVPFTVSNVEKIWGYTGCF